MLKKAVQAAVEFGEAVAGVSGIMCAKDEHIHQNKDELHFRAIVSGLEDRLSKALEQLQCREKLLAKYMQDNAALAKKVNVLEDLSKHVGDGAYLVQVLESLEAEFLCEGGYGIDASSVYVLRMPFGTQVTVRHEGATNPDSIELKTPETSEGRCLIVKADCGSKPMGMV